MSVQPCEREPRYRSDPRSDVVMLAGAGDMTNIIYHHLAKIYGPFRVIMERPAPATHKVKVRLRKLGMMPVLSQLAFLATAKPWLTRSSQAVIQDHCDAIGMNRGGIPQDVITHVESVNAEACRNVLRDADPKIVVVCGTRIIGKKTLASVSGQFVNTHTGITPQYRGAHGGYWALYNRDPERCGVTVHLVDAGIDTGDVLGQDLIRPGPEDSFATYPYLQIAAALPMLDQSVRHALVRPLTGKKVEGESAVWYHPGIGQYLGGLTRGLR
jgi:folate-dependent phosphoribosylglycinamide formyltransferase PurN